MARGKVVLLLLLFSVASTWQIPLDGLDEKETKNWKLKDEQNLQVETLDDDEPTTYRLPNNTVPVRYDIWLKTDIDKQNFAFEGQVKIQIRAVEATESVTLHYRDLTVNQVDLVDASETVLNELLPFEYVTPVAYEFLRITLPRAMAIGEEFILRIAYNATLKTSNAGFYRADYTDYTTANNDTVYYAVTQFESTDARHAFPCFDEPGIRAPIGLRIKHDKSYSAHANMPDISTIVEEGTDYVTTVFGDTPSMQTYLLAFLVSPFDFVPNNDTVFPQRIFAKPASIASGEADYAAAIADPILKKFISHLGVNFTLPKLDHAAITQFAAGAMENWVCAMEWREPNN
jgi:aminopeptidase N